MLQRFGDFTLTAMVVSRARPLGWDRDTVLLRLVLRSEEEVLLMATQQACEGFDAMQKGRIYEINLKGSYVKNAQSSPKYNIRNQFEIKVSKSCRIVSSSETWALKFPYAFAPWETLDQVQKDAFVDIIGRVLEPPCVDPNSSSLQKAVVLLGSGNYTQSVELLGEHAAVQIAVNDVVAFAGLKTKEYQKERSLGTTLLTILEVNPSSSSRIPRVPKSNTDEPKRKAMRMLEGEILTVNQVKSLAMEMQNDAKNNKDTCQKDFFMQGTFKPFDNLLFMKDVLIVGEGLREKLCWPAVLVDTTGEIPVKVWEKPCITIFDMNTSKFREKWEQGVESVDQREQILAVLNANLDCTYRMYCSMRVWSFGGKVIQYKVDVNVNAAQAMA